MLKSNKSMMVTAAEALPGREDAIVVPDTHFVNGHRVQPPFESHLKMGLFGLGCFWGAERKFWQMPGVYSTAVGYAGGFTPNPSYEEVCSGRTGHAEVVLVVYNPAETAYHILLNQFWEAHDPTQGMRQGNDAGTQYRSIILVYEQAQRALAEASLQSYQILLQQQGYPAISTEIKPVDKFYYAEGYHQQYLAKNPQGYCGLGGTGVGCQFEPNV